MNDDLIRQMIRLKMDAAERFIEVLPPETSKIIIDFGKLVLKSIEEYLGSTKAGPSNASPQSVTRIHIE